MSFSERVEAPTVRAAAESTVVAERASSAARSVLVPVLSGFAQERFTNATGFTGRSALYSGARMLLLGAAAWAITFGLGRLVALLSG